jgi:molecular chaperone DnaK
MSDELAIGIDLGTSNSCVAISDGRKVEVLRNSYGEATTASVVAFRDNQSVVVGNAARANLIHDPHNTVASAKRLIGRYSFSAEVKKAKERCAYKILEAENYGVRVGIRDEVFSVPEISAMVLREMKSVAEARLGREVTKAVITVPAYFNDNQRQATKDAGRIAGLEVLRLLNEPTAAALAFGFGRGLNQRVAVYDLGGGTFDISILEIGTDVFEVLATFGDTYLGGDDFDDRIMALLADEFLAKENIELRDDAFALEKLKLAAENAKCGLSVDDTVEINIPEIVTDTSGEALSIQRSLSQSEFTSLVMDLIQRTFKVCDEALQRAGMIARDLDGVILVGGPTRLPVIQKAVGEYFQQKPKAGVDPDQIVAMGAAIHAQSLASSQPQDAYLLDVTPLSLRIGVAGGLAETVIERNTPVPIEQSRNFTTVQDFQESVKIAVHQGESRSAKENELLGQFEFAGFERRRRGETTIEVTFEINGDGIVNVTAREPESGKQASTEITLSSGLSEDEIQQIIERGRTDHLEHDDELMKPSEYDIALSALPMVDGPPDAAPRVESIEYEDVPDLDDDPPTGGADDDPPTAQEQDAVEAAPLPSVEAPAVVPPPMDPAPPLATDVAAAELEYDLSEEDVLELDEAMREVPVDQSAGDAGRVELDLGAPQGPAEAEDPNAQTMNDLDAEIDVSDLFDRNAVDLSGGSDEKS